MRCNEFQKLIPLFIDKTLSEEDYEGFVKHVNSCQDCMDELEIHYMIQIGLERIEQDSVQSFNLKAELNNRLNYYENKADNIFKFRIYRRMILIAAEGCVIIALLMKMFFWLSDIGIL